MEEKKCIVCDCDYNLIKQLTKKLQFLWGIDGYIKDAEKDGHKDCAELFREIKADEEKHAKKMKELLLKKVKEGKLT
ncbi:MAG: hypothetical protein ACE5J7_01020 [Candidatus Aenigmatarchaeota archaeon]